MTGVVILLFTMTTVAISIVRCVIVLFVSASNCGFFDTMISISGFFSSFLFPSDVVIFSSDGGVVLGVLKVVVFFLIVFYFSTSSSIISLESGGLTAGPSSVIISSRAGTSSP